MCYFSKAELGSPAVLRASHRLQYLSVEHTEAKLVLQGCNNCAHGAEIVLRELVLTSQDSVPRVAEDVGELRKRAVSDLQPLASSICRWRARALCAGIFHLF